jgi:hypothetical protein
MGAKVLDVAYGGLPRRTLEQGVPESMAATAM